MLYYEEYWGVFPQWLPLQEGPGSSGPGLEVSNVLPLLNIMNKMVEQKIFKTPNSQISWKLKNT